MKFIPSFFLIISLCSCKVFAQKSDKLDKLDTSIDRVKTDFKPNLKRIGTIKYRTTDDIKSSNWIIGCETLDRDLADYDQYKEYIKPLGMKRLRLQAGWAKTEKIKGQYDWAWLDNIINDAAKRGYQPWLEFSYGNPIYKGGGGINLSAGSPTSEEALKAWDKWAEALVIRYKDKVTDWEVWNEPNFGDNGVNPPERIADLNIRTAEIVKKHQPNAKISGLSLGHIDLKYADIFFKILHEKGKMELFDNMTYHDYFYNPDGNHEIVADLKRILEKYSKTVKLRQGENGCPSSGGGGRGALGDYDWTELSQAKWVSRRMLNNLGHDIECSILSIIEMNYKAENGPINKLNVKGIIQSDSTKRVIRPKMVYYAMQNIASIFDDNLLRIQSLHNTNNPTMVLPKDEVRYHRGTDRSLAVYGYEHKTTKKQAFTIWSDEAIPSNTNAPRPLTFTVINGNFEQPVYVDILTGSVYEIPATQWSKKGDIYTFKNMQIYDAPIVIADKSVLLGFKAE